MLLNSWILILSTLPVSIPSNVCPLPPFGPLHPPSPTWTNLNPAPTWTNPPPNGSQRTNPPPPTTHTHTHIHTHTHTLTTPEPDQRVGWFQVDGGGGVVGSGAGVGWFRWVGSGSLWGGGGPRRSGGGRNYSLVKCRNSCETKLKWKKIHFSMILYLFYNPL